MWYSYIYNVTNIFKNGDKHRSYSDDLGCYVYAMLLYVQMKFILAIAATFATFFHICSWTLQIRNFVRSISLKQQTILSSFFLWWMFGGQNECRVQKSIIFAESRLALGPRNIKASYISISVTIYFIIIYIIIT